MDTLPLLPTPAELHLAYLAADRTGITVLATTRRATVPCPRCGTPARRIHSHYTRTLADLPWHGLSVRLVLTTRRFFCDLAGCSQRIFTERLPGTAAPSARRTRRLTAALDALGLALGGAAGARLARTLGMAVSGDTVRRVVLRSGAEAALAAPPRVVGVDDWAWRRGRSYGTVLVDLERQRVVDLLPDRTSATLAAWLRAHPGVAFVSRDRGGAYAEGAHDGAPDAIQIADRFHLLRNLGDAIEQVVTRHHGAVRAVALACGAADPLPREAVRRRRVSGLPHNAGGPTRAEERSAARRAHRLARYEEAVRLHARGLSDAAIAREMRLDRRTVTTWLRAGRFPERRPRGQPPPRLLDRFADLIRARYEAGLENASQLARELRGLGYTGTDLTVRRYLVWLRRTHPRAAGTGPPPPPRAAFTTRQASWLLRRPSASLTEPERAVVAQLTGACPALGTMHTLAERFRAMLIDRDPNALAPWLADAEATDLRGFARGLARDRDAVLAAILFRWSNGPVEGHVNRLKLLKRQGYGRAGFALLRERVRRAA